MSKELQRQTSQFEVTYQEDECSLTNLVTKLIRRKNTLYSVFLFTLFLGIVAAFVLQIKHAFTIIIGIGLRIEKSEIKLITQAESLLAKVKEFDIPLVLQFLKSQH